ncbi:hypothetical protein MMC30_006755 [Trapelia coarctata]|nr:hypothetical protein [Trapelia coarctata]
MAYHLTSVTALEGTSSSSVMSSAKQKSSAVAEFTPQMPTEAGTFMSSGRVGGFVIASQTLVPGGPAITISGTPISLPPSASDLIIGGTTYAFVSTIQHTPPRSTTLPALTVGGSVITPNTASNYVIGSQTLLPGGPAITISGTLVSLAPSATEVIIGGTTHVLVSGAGGLQPPLPTFTIEGSAVRPNSAGNYIIGSQTLVPGGTAMTISGTPISLTSAVSDLVVGTSTETLVAPTDTAKLGGYIISALGGFPMETSTSTVVFRGQGSRLGACSRWWAFMVVTVGLIT